MTSLPCGCRVSLKDSNLLVLHLAHGEVLEVLVESTSPKKDPLEFLDLLSGFVSPPTPDPLEAVREALASSALKSVKAVSCGYTYAGFAYVESVARKIDAHDSSDSYHTQGKPCPVIGEIFRSIIRHGAGTLTTPSGDTISCVWVEDSQSGEVTHSSKINKYVYIGQVLDNEWHGNGLLKYADGSTYNGQFSHDRPHGHGELVQRDGSKYVGNFKDGELDGQGRMESSNGEWYDGNWDSGRRHGHGECRFANGLHYRGNWHNNRPHGTEFTLKATESNTSVSVSIDTGVVEFREGKLVFSCVNAGQDELKMYGGYSYTGSWVAWVDFGYAAFEERNLDVEKLVADIKKVQESVNKEEAKMIKVSLLEEQEQSDAHAQQGLATYLHAVSITRPDVQLKDLEIFWSGMASLTHPKLMKKSTDQIFEELEPVNAGFAFHGKGILKYGNKEIYSGQWYMGQMHGTGKLETNSGIYEGTMNRGHMDGKGTFISDQKILYTGEFWANFQTGWGTIPLGNELTYEGTFLNGKPHGDAIIRQMGGGFALATAEHGVITLPQQIQTDGDVQLNWEERQALDGEGMVAGSAGVVKGFWKDGEVVGDATIEYYDGRIYRGAVKNMNPLGYGRYDHPDGDILEGTWRKGDATGMTVSYIAEDLCWLYGIKQNDKYHGVVTKLLPDGHGCVFQTFDNGKPVSQPQMRTQNAEDWKMIISKYPDIPGREAFRPNSELASENKPTSTPKEAPSDLLASLLASLKGAVQTAVESARTSDQVRAQQPDPPAPLSVGVAIGGGPAPAEGYSLPGGFVYKGQVVNGLPHGQGTLTGAWNYSYTGSFDKGLKHGKGKEMVPWGHTFEGEFKEGIRLPGGMIHFRTGITGRCLPRPNGIEVVCQKLTIFTRMPSSEPLFNNKRVVVEDVYAVEYNDGISYFGQLDNRDRRAGYGVLKTPDGYKYEGDWMDDLEHGYGSATYPDGVRCLGNWVKGFRSGEGILMLGEESAAKHIYRGGFKEDFRDGKGCSNEQDGSVYEGEFKLGLYHGTGELVYSNGDTYSGAFSTGCRHGNGIFMKSSQYTYDGKFENDLEEGQATVTRDSTTSIENWHLGKQILQD